MIKFHPNKEVNAKPLHNGKVIYADDTCIRVLSSDLLGGGGSEIVGAIFIVIGFFFCLMVFFTGGIVEDPIIMSSFWFGVSFLLILLPIIFFRYKPNYLIFSRKTQEIYYVTNPKSIIRFKWKDVIGEHHKIAAFSGGSLMRAEVLHIKGISQYGDNKPTSTSVHIAAWDENTTKEFWAYLQAYMSNGAKGLEEPSMDRIDGSFFTVAKRKTKQILYTSLFNFMNNIFSPKSDLSFILRILLFPIFLVTIFINYLIYWPGQIATIFVNSTRTRTPFPEDLLPYITDNKESYGKGTEG